MYDTCFREMREDWSKKCAIHENMSYGTPVNVLCVLVNVFIIIPNTKVNVNSPNNE
jgi:hypothetical protein